AAIGSLRDRAFELAGDSDSEREILLSSTLLNVAERLKVCEGGDLILTDDKAPVELLGMKVIDSIIRDEIGYYKDAFKRDGIKGLIGIAS
nr:hypothetical protein [Lachnospiraceae bacterium]